MKAKSRTPKAGRRNKRFVVNADGKGYVQEIAIPWKLLTRDGRVPKPGQTIIMTYEPNFGTAAKMRITTKDLFRAGVTPDRVFAFMASPCWGVAKLEPAGRIAPMPVRLSDGRTFPVRLEKGVPVVDWKGLYKEDKLEGFAKITLQMPEDGFVSLIIKNADGQVVRNLLNAKFLTKGPQEVLWDGLTTPSDRKPGEPVPAGNYTLGGDLAQGHRAEPGRLGLQRRPCAVRFARRQLGRRHGGPRRRRRRRPEHVPRLVGCGSRAGPRLHGFRRKSKMAPQARRLRRRGPRRRRQRHRLRLRRRPGQRPLPP